MHAIGNHDRTLRPNEIVSQQLIPRCHAVARYKSSFSKSTERALHHCFEEDRTRFLLRIQETLKRVQIVASNYCPFRRQFVQQLAVTVIDQVKQIELINDLSRYAWVIPEPIQKPIRIKEPCSDL